jgi:hypothetical protein
MNRDMDIEQSDNRRRARLQQKIEKQIAKIEGVIEELLAGVEMSELSSKDRLFAAVRFITVHQNAISLDDALEQNTIESRDSRAISAILRKVRTEQDRENFHIIDVDITQYPEIEDNEHPYLIEEDV